MLENEARHGCYRKRMNLKTAIKQVEYESLSNDIG